MFNANLFHHSFVCTYFMLIFQQCFEASPVHHEAESAPPKDTFWLVTDDDVIDGGDNDNDEAEI